MHRDENSSTGTEEDDREIQHRKQTDACIAVEDKGCGKNALCYCVGCSNVEQKIIVSYCRPSTGRFCFAKHMKGDHAALAAY